MAKEVGLAIAMLVEAFNVKTITPVRIRIYERALSELPPSLLEPTVMRTIKTRTAKTSDWLPSIEQLLEDAETVRLEMRGKLHFKPCQLCAESGHPGWLLTGATIERLRRCDCWTAHQQRVTALSVGSEPLALPPAEDGE